MRYAFADCVLNIDAHALERGGAFQPVEPQVFDLLHLLTQNPGRLVTRDEIVEAVWQGRIVSEAAISARIAAARKAVGDDGKTQRIIRTVASRGLQMVAVEGAVAASDGSDLTGDMLDDAAPPALGPLGAPLPGPAPRVRYTKNGRGQSIAYAVTGEGSPVLRMSYMMTDVEAEWHNPMERPLYEALSARHRLARFDSAGMGMSDREIGAWTIDGAVEDAIAVADAAGLERFAVYSESDCHEAIRLAARYPDRVTRMVIVGGYVDGRDRRTGGVAPNGADPVSGMAIANWRQPGTGFGLAFLGGYFPETPAEHLHWWADQLAGTCSPEVIAQIRKEVGGASNAEDLGRIRCPTLVIHGRGDAVHPLSEGRRLAAGIADADLLVLDTANHLPLPHLACWPDFMAAVLEFLAD